MQSPIAEALLNASAGTIAGITSYSALYPLENLRTRLQVKDVPSSPSTPTHKTSTSLASEPTSHLTIWNEIKSTLQFILDIYRRDGIKGFYGGLEAGIFGIGVSNAIYLYWYQLLKSLMVKLRFMLAIFRAQQAQKINIPTIPNQTLSAFDNIIVASLAGVINITITNPIWVVNTRMMLQQKLSTAISSVGGDKVVSSDENNQTTSATSETTTTTTKPLRLRVEEMFHKLLLSILYQCRQLYNLSTSFTRKISQLFSQASTSTANLKKDDSQSNDNPSYYTSFIDGLYKLCKAEGLGGLYRGYAASLVLVLNPTIQYVLFDQIIDFLVRQRTQKLKIAQKRAQQDASSLNLGRSLISSWDFFWISALTKACATVITFPYQVVKARQQQLLQTSDSPTAQATPTPTTDQSVDDLQEMKQLLVDIVQDVSNPSSTTSTSSKPSPITSLSRSSTKTTASTTTVSQQLSLYATMRKLYQTDGLSVFFQGLVPKLIQTVTNAAITTVLHEHIKVFLQRMLLQLLHSSNPNHSQAQLRQ